MARFGHYRFVASVAALCTGCGSSSAQSDEGGDVHFKIDIGGEWMHPSAHTRVLVTDEDWTRFGVGDPSNPIDERVLILEFDNDRAEALVTAAPEFAQDGYWKRFWIGPTTSRFGDFDAYSVCPTDIPLEPDDVCLGFYYCLAPEHVATIEEARAQAPPMREFLDFGCFGNGWSISTAPRHQ